MLKSSVLLLICALTFVVAAADKGFVSNDPAKVDADFPTQGEYSGELTRDGKAAKTGVQVIALGDGAFHAVLHNGGLPGDGWDKSKKEEVDGKSADGTTSFSTATWNAKIKDGVMTVSGADGKALGDLKKVTRESPTMGAKPPDGAMVLFDGTTADNFKGGRMTEDKLLMEGVDSKHTFQNASLHLEFRLPYMPSARGQGRGNSGCYMQGRYETQILDSFGLAGKNNECGGIYTISDPAVNMCFPPLSWQTYDIDYTTALYDDTGKKTKNARITVKHNGVVVQNDVELPKGTTSAPVKESKDPGPLHLQNHGNPVRFRNIWLLEKK